jgi:hypothetical protein
MGMGMIMIYESLFENANFKASHVINPSKVLEEVTGLASFYDRH